MVNQKTYSSKEIQNDASTRSPNLTLALHDLDPWPHDPKVDHFISSLTDHLCEFVAKPVLFIFKISCSQGW